MTDLATPPLPSTRRLRCLGGGDLHRSFLYEYQGVEEVRRFLAPGVDPVDALRDAMRTRAIAHPGVARVHDLVTDSEGVALRTEFVSGRDLARLVDDDGVMTTERVAALGSLLAEAIDAAHRRDILHGGIRPSNVIVRADDDMPVLNDFGVAAATRSTDKLPFIAPELRAGGAPTRAGDVWSLGATLHFMAGASAPIAAATDAGIEPLPTLLQHVPLRFWKLLAPLLDPRPEARPTAAAVSRDLREYVACLACPACQQVFRVESIHGGCPDPRCRSEQAERLKQASAAHRAGEGDLADCRFELAAPHLSRARDAYLSCANGAADAEALAALLGGIDWLAREHEASVAAVTELLADERWVDAARRLREARRRHSRSASLKALRSQLREQLATFHGAVPGKAQAESRNRRFDAAREIVAHSDRILGDATTYAELAAGLQQTPEHLTWLAQEIERQEQGYRLELRRAREAIDAFRFDEALDAYTRLERDFPALEHRAAIDALSQAPADFAAATKHAEDTLRQLVRRPDLHHTKDDLDLEEARRACQRLLAAFDPDQHPSFRALVTRGELLDEAMCAVRKHVKARLEAAESARTRGQLFEETDHLTAVRDLVLKSDLYDLHQREHVLARHRQAAHDAERVRTLHTQALTAISTREHARALTHLREIRDLDAQCLPDLDELVRTVESTLRRMRDLRTEVVRMFGRLQANSPLPTIVAVIEKAQTLYQLCDDGERSSWDGEIARALASALHRLQETCLAADGGADAVVREVVPLLHSGFVPLAHALPAAHWVALLRDDAELRRRLCAVAEAALPAPGVDLDVLLRQAMAWAQFWSGEASRPLLAGAAPPPGIPHPTILLARRLIDACQRTTRRDRLILQSDLTSLIHNLVGLAPDCERDRLDEAGEELRRRCAQDNLAVRLDTLRQRTLRFAPWLLATAALAAGGLALGLRLGEERGTELAVASLLPEGLAGSEAAAFVAQHRDQAATLLGLALDLRTALADKRTPNVTEADSLLSRLVRAGTIPTDAPRPLADLLDGARPRLVELRARTLEAELDRTGEVEALQGALADLCAAARAPDLWTTFTRLVGDETRRVAAEHRDDWRRWLDQVQANAALAPALRAAARAHLGRCLQVELESVARGDVRSLVARTQPACELLATLEPARLPRRSILADWSAVVDALAQR